MTSEPIPQPTTNKRDPLTFDAHRLAMIEIVRKYNQQAGVVDDPTISTDQILNTLYANQKARGIRPEDNEASRELLRQRYDFDEQE